VFSHTLQDINMIKEPIVKKTSFRKWSFMIVILLLSHIRYHLNRFHFHHIIYDIFFIHLPILLSNNIARNMFGVERLLCKFGGYMVLKWISYHIVGPFTKMPIVSKSRPICLSKCAGSSIGNTIVLTC